MSNDLKNMSKKQLEKLQKDVVKALASIQTKEKREARKAAEKAAAKFGFKLNELTPGSAPAAAAPKKKGPKKAAAPAKYANPADKSQTWTGKGRQPLWFKTAVDAGKTPSSMEI